MTISRRGFVQLAGAGALMHTRIVRETVRRTQTTDLPEPLAVPSVSKVALVHGEDRRRNIRAALELIDDQIRPCATRSTWSLSRTTSRRPTNSPPPTSTPSAASSITSSPASADP